MARSSGELGGVGLCWLTPQSGLGGCSPIGVRRQQGSGAQMANGQPLSSEDLAVLIVDALVDADLIPRSAFEAAVAVAAQEIEVRKAMGDYAPDAARPSSQGGAGARPQRS